MLGLGLLSCWHRHWCGCFGCCDKFGFAYAYVSEWRDEFSLVVDV